MSSKVLGCSLLCLLVCSVGGSRPWLNRKDVVKTLPLQYQKAILMETLNQQKVQLTDDVPKQLNGQIPEMVEFLVNGAIDVYLSQTPGVSQILGPIIRGGIGLLTNMFGKRKVYIPNMPPILTCPASITRIADKGKASTVVSWTVPFGYDAEDGTIYNVRRRGKPPGSKFIGEEIIQYDVSDSKGRTDFCRFSITVRIVKCPPIPLANHRINTCRGPTPYRVECRFSCQKGYQLDGQQKLTCTRDGVYNLQAPTCKKINCPPIPMELQRVNTCKGPTRYGDECSFSCLEGYKLDGQQKLTCTRDGVYDRQAPTCKKNRLFQRLDKILDLMEVLLNATRVSSALLQ